MRVEYLAAAPRLSTDIEGQTRCPEPLIDECGDRDDGLVPRADFTTPRVGRFAHVSVSSIAVSRQYEVVDHASAYLSGRWLCMVDATALLSYFL